MNKRRQITYEERLIAHALAGALAAGATPTDAVDEALDAVAIMKQRLIRRGDGLSCDLGGPPRRIKDDK